MKSVGLEKAKLPAFYIEVFKLWSESGNTVPVDKGNWIWYNKNICVNNKAVFYNGTSVTYQ
jgi:hypothetical protein